MAKLFKTDLFRAIVNWKFLLGIAISFLLLLQANYSELLAIPEELKWKYSNVRYFGIALNFSYLPIVASAICAIIYSSSFCDERNSGFFYYSVSRSKVKYYIISKFLSNDIAGGLVLGFGVFLYGMFLSAISTPISSNLTEHILPYSDTIWSGIYMKRNGIIFIAMMSFQYFVYGFIFSNIGMTATTFIKNKYISFTFPFVIAYVVLYLTQRLRKR